jgi:EAL domain-containing protein (putative c-di-GMP-specific phosphodiesterase class I)
MLAADSFRDALADYRFVYEGRNYVIHSSIGIDIITDDTRSAGEALANADIACYVAKNRGRNNCHLFDGNHDHKAAMDMELGWSARLREALDNNRFVLYFQPILPVSEIDRDRLDDIDDGVWDDYLECREGGTLYYEALLRLKGSDGKLIYPDAFLPTAERFNMMKEIDYWVINSAVRLIADWNTPDTPIHLAVNLSGQTMDDEDLHAYISGQLQTYQVDPSSITFEVTESSAISNMDSANRIIDTLGGEGCSFALDDFGSGYCSLSHLKHIPVDYIKIDGAFVQGLLTDPIDMAIVNSVVRIAHSAGKFTVAEYVDNPEVMKVLIDCGVDFVQGFYISRPRPTIDADKSLLENMGSS